MADLLGSTISERDLERILAALKKGTQLLKYGRKGKPKFCPFRLSYDETTLIWHSGSGERYLKLSTVSKIIPGQRTPVFQRYLRPDKDYLSFSLIYNEGKRSLDLICKDKVEAEVWFSGLKTLISLEKYGRPKIDGWNNGEVFIDGIRELAPNGVNDFSVGSPLGSSERRLTTSSLQKNISFEHSVYSEKSDATIMHSKATSLDGIRTSISSIPSTSSHGSTQDDFDASGDVYVWGEVASDNSSRVSADISSIPSGTRTDILLPKPLESNVVLDIQQVACGVRHAAILTRQGELFTWGEEAGGRLGHGVGSDIVHPRLLESLSALNVDYVACGEFHTCAVTLVGELYTWGDGTHNAGLLGHGSNASYWMPKRVAGPLDGLQVSLVSCGVWHTALITTTGQLFAFGDGTFGVLGHGNRETVLYPREVESVSGLRTIAVSCGVWHTAAIVEVIVAQSSTSSGKLFTWGDGDKYRLGHSDKESRLKPTCVASLIDYNFHKVACGHSLTIGLTTSGQVFTMGSTVYGQLGNPRFDGKVPCPVEDKLMNESVSEVSCGSYHVAVLTVRGEVYTWGKGANGRLGHGDIVDRKMPTLVETLKDRPVKRISCGSSFTAAICQHKWVSGAEQTQCSACRQTFGFTRKRHNCYNCGLVHCHQCSSRKSLRAALAPNPGKPYRVCDSCFVKLSNSLESGGSSNRKYAKPRLSNESKDKFDKYETSSVKSSKSSNLDLIKNLDIKAAKNGKNSNYLTMARTAQLPPLLQLRNIAFPGGADMNQVVSRTVLTLAEKPKIRSRAISPFSRKPSPPRSTTPTPTMSGLSFSASISESLKKTNDLLSQELLRLRAEVDTLWQRCDHHELEMQKSERKAQEAIALAAEESAKSKAAKEVIKSLTAQLKEMAARFPTQLYDDNSARFMQASNGLDSNTMQQSDISSRLLLGNATASNMDMNTRTFPLAHGNGLSSQYVAGRQTIQANDSSVTNHANIGSNAAEEDLQNELRNGDAAAGSSHRKADLEARRAAFQNHDYDSMPRSPNSASNQVEAEWIEQFEPGVYITLIALRDGTRDLKRVRFSRRRFGEQQAEVWWSENRDRVYQKYNFRSSGRNSTSALDT